MIYILGMIVLLIITGPLCAMWDSYSSRPTYAHPFNRGIMEKKTYTCMNCRELEQLLISNFPLPSAWRVEECWGCSNGSYSVVHVDSALLDRWSVSTLHNIATNGAYSYSVPQVLMNQLCIDGKLAAGEYLIRS